MLASDVPISILEVMGNIKCHTDRFFGDRLNRSDGEFVEFNSFHQIALK
jgi:hypothetical protein